MEVFDLYDKDRQKTDKTMKRGMAVPDDHFRMVVHAALFGSNGKMLIQQRQNDKESWPDLWDLTVGGHVRSGETSSECVGRELDEELGIKIDFSDKRPCFTVNFDTGFDDYYVVTMDVDLNDINLQTEEVQAARWASLEKILEMIDKGVFIPYKKSLIKMLFEMKGSIGAHRKKRTPYS